MLQILPGTRGRTPSRVRPWAVVVAAALVAGPPARANIRAPRIVPESPSAALSAPSVPLEVTSERLEFRCGADACLVTARYEVTAAAAVTADLDFVLPVGGPVTAATNDGEEPVQVVPAAPLRGGEAGSLPPPARDAPPLFRAGFRSRLREGRNTLTVRYSQPLGAEEADYGYGRAGWMVQKFRYELWPLREWTRGPAFRLQLSVTVDRPAPSWWARTFGHPRSIACLTSDPSMPAVAGRLQQRGGELRFEADLGPAFPDRFTCYIGDEDLMPRY